MNNLDIENKSDAYLTDNSISREMVYHEMSAEAQ